MMQIIMRSIIIITSREKIILEFFNFFLIFVIFHVVPSVRVPGQIFEISFIIRKNTLETNPTKKFSKKNHNVSRIF